jgi:hypothetical protein
MATIQENDMNFEEKVSSGYYSRTNIEYSKENRKAYHEERSKLEAEFRNDLFNYWEVQDNPKCDKAFSIAWDHGHSAGYSEVASHFADLVDLIK